MRTMNILVAMMAMIIGTAAMNTASAQGRNHNTPRQEARANNGGHGGHGNNRGGEGRHHQAHNAPAGGHHDAHVGGHHNAYVGGHHDAHHAPHYNHNAHYAGHAHYAHHDLYRGHHYYPVAYGRPVCHYYRNMPVYVHHEYRHTAPVVIHSFHHGYVPVVGDFVDCLPDNYVSVNIGGVHLFRALGHIFRPVTIDGCLRFIVE